MKTRFVVVISLVMSISCTPSSRESASFKQNEETSGKIKLIILDPGHFHAALVQKNTYNQIDSVVHVYAPKGKDVQEHLGMIKQYNSRLENPTHWVEKVYLGADFFDKLLEEKKGNVVVLAGSNDSKINYIKPLLDQGLNVLADKPLVINPEGFSLLKNAFDTALENQVLLYDMMTERYNIFSILQKEFSQMPALFGDLQKGTPEEPAVFKKSVHHIFKNVSGKPLIRPTWFFDVDQQGEGITDVTTHFVDLILWECFPKEAVPIDETEVISARRWATEITPGQFQKVTGLSNFPKFLEENISKDSVLNLFSNGDFVFKANGIHGKVSVTWNFEAPEGTTDTYFSKMRGTKANLIIRQGKEQNYQPVLYVEPVDNGNEPTMEEQLKYAINKINKKYPGITYKPAEKGWEVVIPGKLQEGHETHFSKVMAKYLQYLEKGKLPDWEKELMLTKYYITTQAYKLSRNSNNTIASQH